MNENDSTHDQCEVPALTGSDYLAAAKAGSTRKEYQKDMRYFADAGYAIPATVDQVASYLTQMAGHLAVSTIEQAARNAALLLVGWAGAFRRIELAVLRCEDVLWLDSGVEITLRQSKVDQTGAGFVKFLPNAHGSRSPHLALQH